MPKNTGSRAWSSVLCVSVNWGLGIDMGLGNRTPNIQADLGIRTRTSPHSEAYRCPGIRTRVRYIGVSLHLSLLLYAELVTSNFTNFQKQYTRF
jgi:hypothetical protein